MLVTVDLLICSQGIVREIELRICKAETEEEIDEGFDNFVYYK